MYEKEDPRLEIFAGSARLSQRWAVTGPKVGTPIHIRTGFDVMTSKGRAMVMEIIREQALDLILMEPVCGPRSSMQNIQQDQQKASEKRKRFMPMVEFVALIAHYQLKHKRCFIIGNPQTSRIWHVPCTQQLFQVCWWPGEIFISVRTDCEILSPDSDVLSLRA